MPKDKTKEIVREYWKAFVEGIISPFILYAFMSINTLLFILGIAIILIDLYTLYYSIVELEDPKFLIIFLITEIFFGGSKDGK
jgi:uncharacterized RDD family membrane protein YckC